MTHCCHTSSLSALFSSSIKVSNRLLTFPFEPRLCQGQIGNVAVITQWVLMFTIYDIYWNYKCKYRPQEADQQCCRKWWLQFFCFFWSKPLAGTWSTDWFISHSSISAPPLPVFLPLFLLILLFLLVTQFCSSSCICFLFPTSSLPFQPPEPRAPLYCPPSRAALIHSNPHALQWTATQISAQADWKSFHRMDSPQQTVNSGC